MSDWHSIGDVKPKRGVRVLAWDAFYRAHHIATLDGKRLRSETSDDTDLTHWCFLPDAPEFDEEDA